MAFRLCVHLLFLVMLLAYKDEYTHGKVENIYMRVLLTHALVFVVQVVAIRDIIPPPQRNAFNDVYIAYELMDTDLHQIIRSNQALSEEHCQVLV